MKWPSILNPKRWIKPKCWICGQRMKEIDAREAKHLTVPDGALTFRCPNGHEFSPGLVAKNPLPNSGHHSGEI